MRRSARATRDRLRARTQGAVLVVLAAALWGTAGVTGRLADGAGVEAVTVAAARVLVAAAVLVPVAAVVVGRAPTRGGRSPTVREALVAGGLLAGYQAAYFPAVDRAGVTVATLVALGGVPVLVALAAPLVGDARPGPRERVALAAALVGLVAVVGGSPDAVPVGGALVVGVALAGLASACFAGVTLVGRALAGADPVRTVTAAFAVGAVPAAGVLVVVPPPATPEAIGLLLWVGIIPTAVAYLLFFRGTAATTAPVAALASLAEPVTAVALSVVVLAERPSLSGVAGAALVLVAIAAAANARERPRA